MLTNPLCAIIIKWGEIMLKTILLSELYGADYDIRILNVLKQRWKSDRCFSCISSPKKQNNFTYLKSCNAVYTLKSGEVITAAGGDIVYTPTGSRYKVEFKDFAADDPYTIGINFHLLQNGSTPFILNENVTVIRPRSQHTGMLFCELEACFAASATAKIKSVFYELMSELICLEKNNISVRRFAVIEKGIRYLEETAAADKTVKEIAKMCCVSEIYFRKLFKEYSGMPPAEYIMKTKIEKAKRCLRYDNLTVSEASGICGFESAAHFSKMFKRKTGLSPLRYKKIFE